VSVLQGKPSGQGGQIPPQVLFTHEAMHCEFWSAGFPTNPSKQAPHVSSMVPDSHGCRFSSPQFGECEQLTAVKKELNAPIVIYILSILKSWRSPKNRSLA